MVNEWKLQAFSGGGSEGKGETITFSSGNLVEEDENDDECSAITIFDYEETDGKPKSHYILIHKTELLDIAKRLVSMLQLDLEIEKEEMRQSEENKNT